MQIPNRMLSALRMTASVALAAGVLVACQKESGTVQVTQKKTVAAPSENAASAPESDTATMNRMGFQQSMPQTTAPASGFRWEAPDGWQDAGATSMRMANFTLGPDGETECYLSVLPGGAGGLVANVNRWRKQIGLDPLSDDEVKALPTIPMLGGEAAFVDFKGTYTGMGEAGKSDYEMLGALLDKPDQMVFVKMVGPAAVVSQEQDAFKAFCASLSETGEAAGAEAGALPPNHPPIGNMPSDMGTGGSGSTELSWTTPDGWQEGPQKPMRSVTLVPAPESESECYVAELTGNGGGVAANINRWRGQMGQQPLTAGEVENLPKITVLGQPSPMVEIPGTYQGMTGEPHQDYLMYGVVVILPERSVFIKMIGPAEELKAQKQNFIAFCESLTAKGTPA